MIRATGTRDRLLEATLDLIWDESLAAASVEAICDRAEVQKGSFYHFFKSKADLFAAALEAKFQSLRPELDRIFSPARPPVERLRSWLDLVYQSQVQKREQVGHVVGCPFASVGASCSTEDQAIREKVRELLAIQLKYLETTIRDGQADGSIPLMDARLAAESVHDYLEGALTAARIQNALKPVENLGRAVFALLGLKWVGPAASANL
jgi:TetR/AcrR family transcriptional repressor of nem operon